MLTRALKTALAALLAAVAAPRPIHAQSIDPLLAGSYLREAREVVRRDGGALWGRTLAAPILLVHPGSRELLTDEADSAGVLSARGGLYTGSLPASENVYNGAIRWAGRTWAMVMWPLPTDSLERRALLAHELWHRVQVLIGLPAGNPSNPHLSTRDGRTWMRLEGRALLRAVSSRDSGRALALGDAVAFRRHRRGLSPTADSTERGLERNEGLAEDTGVRLAAGAGAARLAMVQRRLRRLDSLPALERAFPYRTGPAYGLLLDQLRPGWRKEITGGADLAELAIASISPPGPEESIDVRAGRYGFTDVASEEAAKEQARLARVAELRRPVVEGPVRELPMTATNVSFDPGRGESLEGAGTVYGVMRLIGPWGVLNVESGGGLVSADWSRAFVTAPSDREARPLKGSGWILELSTGWRLTPGSRAGSWRVEQAP
jgi:hypothetical protein